MNLQHLQPFIFPIVIIAIFYFVLYRPQKNQQKKREMMINSVQVGNRVVTLGGIYGEVTAINGRRMRLKVAENVEIEVALNSVGKNLSQDKNAESNKAAE